MNESEGIRDYILPHPRRDIGVKIFSAMKWIGPWLLFLGTWPFADPGHGSMNFVVLVDLFFHLLGLFFTGLLMMHWMGAIEVTLKFKWVEER